MDEKFFKSTLIEHFEISHNENEDVNKILKERLKTYDFTDNWRKTEVDRLWKLKHSRYSSLPTFTKYFIYKLSDEDLKKNEIREQKYYYPRFYEAWKEQISSDYIEYMVDPDSESEILQGIYEYLWGGTILEKCTTEEKVLRISLNELELEKVKVIKGDTLNSAQTTLSHFFRNKYSKDEQYYASTKLNGYTKYDKEKRIVSCNGHLWHCIDIYLNEEKKINDEIKNAENKEQLDWCIIEEFLRVNHTLGNFIPLPFKTYSGFTFSLNSDKNNCFKDYWDIMLYFIYKWYKEFAEKRKIDEVEEKYNDEYLSAKHLVKWLCSFSKDDKPCWDEFVEKNFLQPFVIIIKEGDGAVKEKYGYPIPFFLRIEEKRENNNISDTMRRDAKEIQDYFEQLSEGNYIEKLLNKQIPNLEIEDMEEVWENRLNKKKWKEWEEEWEKRKKNPYKTKLDNTFSRVLSKGLNENFIFFKNMDFFLPENEVECIEFFKNVTSCVEARTELMVNKLMEELNESQRG